MMNIMSNQNDEDETVCRPATDEEASRVQDNADERARSGWWTTGR